MQFMDNKKFNKAGFRCVSKKVGLLIVLTSILGAQSAYAAPADENYDDDSGTTITNQNTFNFDGVKYTITGTGTYSTRTHNMDLVGDPSTGSPLGNNTTDYFLQFDTAGTGGISSFRIEAQDGSYFKLSGLSIDGIADANITITPYDGVTAGTPVDYISNSLFITQENINLSANTNFQYITSFTISGGNVVLNLDDLNFETAVPPNTVPTTSNLNGDSVAWAGVGNTVSLDASSNANLADTELDALNSGNGNWQDATITIQRSGTAITSDTFGFNTSGALFTVSGSNLQSGGLTFGTFTNTNGVLTITFTSSGTTATSALVDDVAQRITYRSDTPAGDATVSFTVTDGDGGTATAANVTVTSDTIYVINTTDTATIDITNGVSFSEAVAIAAADATGSQTIAFSSSLAATALTISSVSLNESLTLDMDAASGMSLTSGTITLGAATTQTVTNGTSDTASITGVIAGSGALTKAGAGSLTLSNTNTYSGTTTVSAGTLIVSGGAAIHNNGAVVVSAGAGLTISATEEIGSLSGAGTVTVPTSQTLNVSNFVASTFSGNLTGAGGLTINQSNGNTNALTLTGDNSGLTGQVRLVNYGRLTVNGENAIADSAAVTANFSSVLTLLSNQTVGSLASNASAVSLDIGSFTLTTGGNNGSTTVSGVISGTGNLVKQGSGTLTLAGTNTYSGTTTVSAGTLSVASDSNLGSNSVTLASGATLDITGATNIDNAIALSGDATVSASANATLSGVVSGANTLTKAGASTLTLSNTNTYAGTTISAGTLSVASDNNLGSGTVTLASGSTLEVTGATTIDNAIALSGNATISNSANATLSGVISGANTLTKAGASTLTLSNTNTYAGTTVSAGTLSVASDSNLGSGDISLAAGTTLAVTGATTIDNAIVLTGNATISVTANATLSGVISGGFNLTKSGASTLTLSGANTYSGTTTVSAGTINASDSNFGSGGLTLAAGTTLAVTGIIDNAVTLSGAATLNTTGDATLSGNIGGAGSLAKTGANTLTLSGSNSYAGTTTVSAGTLSVAGDGNLGSSTVTLATGTTLAVTGATTIDNAIALSGNATMRADDAATLGGAISGAGGFTKTGAGTLTLSGSNGFTGNVAVSAGGLTLSNGAAIDNGSAVTLSSGTTLTLSSSETIGSLAGAGSVALGANTLTMGGDNSSTSYSGNISGTGGGITKAGAGTLTLSGTNSNTGATTISAGAIDVQNGDAIGDASAVSVASGAFLVLSGAESIGSLAGAGDATLGANTLTAGGNNTSTTFSGAITGSNGMVKTGSGTLTLSNTGNESTLSGGMTISAGTVSISDDDQMAAGTLTLNGGTLSLNGPTVFDNNIDLAASSTINAGGNAIASGVISGAGDLTKTGSLSLQLTNTNTYTGATFVNAGYLLANNANSLGSTAGATTVASGATLYLSGSFTLAEALNLAGTGTAGNGAIYAPSGSSTITGLALLTDNTTIIHDGDLTFSAGITDVAGSYSLIKDGTGTLTLSDTASYDGTTTISSGGLSIGSDSHLGSGALTLATGTTLAVTGATTIDNAMVLSGGTVTVNTSAITTMSGNITGAGGLTKAGASILTLSGTDSYSGATDVNAGSLLVNGALSATSNTAVASAATLGGSGSISSNVTVNSGGTLSPGNSAGSITINGNLTMAAGSTLAVEINGAVAGTEYDQVNVNGTVDVSSATLSTTHGYTAGSGDIYTIIANDAADAVTGTFSGIAEGATLIAGGNSTELTASYIGGTGNDFTLTAPLAPSVTSVSASTSNGSYKIGDTISLTITFDTAVTVDTTGGTPSLALETGVTDRTATYVSGSGGTTLSFSYTIQAGDVSADLDYVSTAALVLNGGTIQDSGTSDNAMLTLASPGAANSLGANKALVIDGVIPTAGVVVADTALAAGETSTVTITFSEAVSGLAIGDFTVENGALSSVSTGDGGITWTATLTPTASTSDTSNLITLDNTGVADAAGNTGTGTTDSNNYAIDTLRPTASIVVADSALAVGETSTVTITFNEAVTGLAIGDFTVENGVLSGVSSGDGGITWTATLTPSASVEDATNLITLDNTGVVDAAGNTGSGTTDSNSYALDGIHPTASVVVADTALTAGETSTVTITFSEAVTGLATGDFTVANGALSGVSTGDGGITWTATLTPTASVEDTTNLITLDNTGVADGTGNAGTGTTDSNNYAMDTLRPTASIVVDDTTLAVSETATVTITFNEAVSGLAIGDFTVENGVLSGVSTGDGGITWTATLTPTASTTDPTNVITLDNTGVTDAVGNAGTGTTDSNNYAIDSQRATASVVVADTALRIGETSGVTITFSEAVTGLTTADFTVANGVLSGLSSSDGGITWTATLTPNNSVNDATNLITLDNTGVVDSAGNAGSGTTDSNNYAIDTVRPAITGSITVSDIALKTGDTATVTFTFTEAVTGFTTADLTVGNGVVSSLSTSDGGITWTATLTPNTSVSAATNVITLDLTGIQDAAGNAGAGTSDSVNYAIDTSNPTVASVSVPVNGIYAEGQVLSFTINTDSAITVDTTGGTPRIALTIGTDTRYANYVSGSGSSALVFSYTVQVNDNDADGIALAASIDSNSSTLRDVADNDMTLTLNAVGVTTGVLVDTAAPADPVVTTPAAAVDTNAVEYAVIGTHEEEGATISLYLDADNNGAADNATVVDSAVVASGDWSLTAPLVSDSANNFVVIAEDTAGNVSAAVDVSTILQDSIAPAAPVALDMQDASDTGVSATDNLTNSTTPTVTGTAEANATVTLTSDVDGAVGTATANDTGNWTITTSALSAGAHNLTATATDAAANTGIASSALAVTIDTSLPTVGTVANQELIALASTDALAVAVGDNNTTAANVVLTSTSSNINVVALEAVVLGGSDANRTVTVTALATGTSTITLTVEDEAGNTASSSFTVGVNAAPTISGVPAATVDQGMAYSFTPTALDGDSDTLVFSITNQPAWAAFDTATGALTGTPTRANVGITSGIVISVTDGVETASLAPFAIEVFDSTAPILTAPADLELDATALYTPVSLKRLVGLDEDATQEALDAAIADLATDSTDGNACCTTAPEDLTENNNFLLTPGRHEIVWKTTNGEGLTAEATQVVEIRPIVSFSKSQVAIRGSEVSFRIILNGKSPTYPLTVSYVIDESTTAQSEEHSLVNGEAVFEEGQFSVTIPVTLNAGTGESELAVRFGSGEINEGVANRHVISIREGNIPPVVTLSIQQDGLNTSLVTPAGGLVTVTATVTDLNLGDTHTFDWSATSGLADTDNNLTDATRVFDPTTVTGSRQVVVTVTDSEGASVQASAYFRVVTDLPVLEDDTDTDLDGIDDVVEGTGDADDNGIPDYLDNMPSPNILPQQANTTNAYLIECDPGVRCGLGLFARGGSSGGVQILEDELTTLEGLVVDPTFEPVGGIFDFAMRDLPTPGQSVRVVLPQRTAIPANAVYRKFQRGQWVSFVVDANNAIHSAAGNPGYCPPPGTDEWTPGLSAGHLCVQLTIEDGGANDDDGLVNSAVVDPGVVSTLIYVEPPIAPPIEVKSNGGGAMGGFWLFLLGGLMMLKRISLKAGALVLILLASVNSSAKSPTAEVSKNYLRLDLFQARGEQSQADFQRGLDRAGYDVTITRYDINRLGGQIAFGRQWTDFTYSELGYMDLRDVKVDFLLAGDTDITAFERDLDKHYPLSANGITLVQGFTHALDKNWDLSAELGAFVWEQGIDFSTTQIDLRNDDGVDLLLGLQISYQLADDSRLGVSLRRLDLDGETIDVMGFTGRLHF